ncbi:MAG: hypothetical protein ACTSR7_15365 [Promethearchaeota archaeon]
MVSIDFRLGYDVTKEQIFEMLRSIGYVHVRMKPKAVKKGIKLISAEEYIMVEESGRFHIFVEFSTKSSGTEAYPQIDIHAHYDHFRKIGNKETHVTRRNTKKDLREMYVIHDALNERGYGYMEYKSQNSAHDTFKTKNKKVLVSILERDYKYNTDGKYKRIVFGGQITFQIVEQRRFSHTICVYAFGIKHDLFRDKAIEESNRIMDELAQLAQSIGNIKQSQPDENIEQLKSQNVELYQKSLALKEERDALNVKTQEFISSLKEIEEQINKEKHSKSKQTLNIKKIKLEKKLIKNKKLADAKHEEYIQAKKEAKKAKQKIKKVKKSLKKN